MVAQSHLLSAGGTEGDTTPSNGCDSVVCALNLDGEQSRNVMWQNGATRSDLEQTRQEHLKLLYA